MHQPNRKPTETSFGASHERDDLMGQQLRNSRLRRWVRAVTRVAFVLLVAGILAAIIVGPARAIDWIGSYLVPVATVLGVVVGAFGLLMWGVIKLYGWGYKIY